LILSARRICPDQAKLSKEVGRVRAPLNVSVADPAAGTVGIRVHLPLLQAERTAEIIGCNLQGIQNVIAFGNNSPFNPCGKVFKGRHGFFRRESAMVSASVYVGAKQITVSGIHHSA